jgi:Txe/YoeB family toxin of Txe-Axe toxin-antitoxin module
MKLIFSENAWEDYLYWQKTDKRTLSFATITDLTLGFRPTTATG